jgi:hypothetical protein
MEQDRAPAVLPYHSDLARHTTDQPVGGGGADRLHDHQDRFDRSMRTRQPHLPQGDQGQRRRDGQHQYQGRCVPSRVELYHLAQGPALTRELLGVALLAARSDSQISSTISSGKARIAKNHLHGGATTGAPWNFPVRVFKNATTIATCRSDNVWSSCASAMLCTTASSVGVLPY